MSSATAASAFPDFDAPEVETCDLCIVGGGVAGMNALFSASVHLSEQSRVILIDKNPRAGGMWTQTYDYVRLHQPHPMFTAGNISWTLGREAAHLASKSEVLSHLEHCLATLRKRVDLVGHFETEFLEHREVRTEDGYAAELLCGTPGSGKPSLRIKAGRLIKAFGYDIPQNEPLALTSNQVRSVSPHSEAFLGAEMDASDGAIYVIGGGKTGMDTAHELIRRYPGRRVRLIGGRGTVFVNRNVGFPKGFRRWWGGITGFRLFRDLALRFNGDNESEMLAFFKQHYAIGPHPDCAQYMFGVISEEEIETIKQGLDEVILDYASDVVDRDGAPEMVFRSGAVRTLEAGDWLVNCSGHLLRNSVPYEPYLSDHGSVLSISPTSAVHFLTTYGSYFLVHLFYLGKLDTLPLYELNQQELADKSKFAFSAVSIAHAFYNTIVIVGAVPIRVMQEFGLNFDLWYPTHRRLIDALRLKRNAGTYAAHCRKSLDRVRERFGIRCGLLPRTAAHSDRQEASTG